MPLLNLLFRLEYHGIWTSPSLQSFVLILIFTPSLVSADSLGPALDQAKKINVSAQRTQAEIDRLATESDALSAELQTLIKEMEGLRVYNRQLERQIKSQEQEYETIKASINQVGVVERQISPLMLRMVAVLGEFVSLDLPFKRDERVDRVTKLREAMDKSSVSVAEKFRNIMEAYDIEQEYGHTMEYYPGSLIFDGKPLEVNFLRLGRIALVYQTMDGNNIGIWNKYLGTWEPLSDIYKLDVRRGLKIALKQLTPRLIELPIPAPEASQGGKQ